MATEHAPLAPRGKSPVKVKFGRSSSGAKTKPTGRPRKKKGR